MKQPSHKALTALLAVSVVLAASAGTALAQGIPGNYNAPSAQDFPRHFDGPVTGPETGEAFDDEGSVAQANEGRGQTTGGAQRSGGGREAMKQKMQQKMKQELGLSDEQVQALEAIKKRGMEQGKPLHEQLRVKRKAMSDYMKTPGATEAGALQRFREVNALQQKLGELRLETFFAMREKLTPEQAAKFSAMMDKMQGNMERSGMGGGGRSGGGPGQRRGQFGGQKSGQRFNQSGPGNGPTGQP